MKIIVTNVLFIERKNISKLIVKALLILCCTTVFGFSTDIVFSQHGQVIIDSNKTVTIFEVLDLIGEQTECTFIYKSNIFEGLPELHLKKGVVKVLKLLKKCLPEEDFKISATKKGLITISRKSPKILQESNREINGVVTNPQGAPIAGVNILIEGTNRGTISNFDGSYTIDATPTDILVFSALGYVPQSLSLIHI